MTMRKFVTGMALGFVCLGFAMGECPAGETGKSTSQALSVGKDDEVLQVGVPLMGGLGMDQGKAAAWIRFTLTCEGKPLAGKEVVAGTVTVRNLGSLAVARAGIQGELVLRVSDLQSLKTDDKGCLQYQAKPEALKGPPPPGNGPPSAEKIEEIQREVTPILIVRGGKSLKDLSCSARIQLPDKSWKELSCGPSEGAHEITEEINGVRLTPETMPPLVNKEEAKRIGALLANKRTKSGMKYTVLLPNGYDKKNRYPLVVCLHSAGGDESEFPTTDGKQAMTMGFIMASPKAAGERWGTADNPGIIKVVEEVTKEYSVDTSAVTLMGASNGGIWVYNLGLAHPEVFSSMVSLCGGLLGTPTLPPGAEKTRVYIVHGTLDTSVPIEHARKAKAFLAEKGFKNVVYKELEGVGHWTPPAEMARVFKWLKEKPE